MKIQFSDLRRRADVSERADRIPNAVLVFKEPKYPSPRGEGSVVRRTVNDRAQNSSRERSERHSDADYIFLYNKAMASLVPLTLSEGNLIASQSDAWQGVWKRKTSALAEISPPTGGKFLLPCSSRRPRIQEKTFVILLSFPRKLAEL